MSHNSKIKSEDFKRNFRICFLRHRKAILYNLVFWAFVSAFVLVYFWRKVEKVSIGSQRVVLDWTAPDPYEINDFCGIYQCLFTSNRKYLSRAEAVYFYGSHLSNYDWPLPRQSRQLWALQHEESPRNKPFFFYSGIWRHFNVTSTFSRYSTVPLTTQYLPDARDITMPDYVVTIGQKNLLRGRLAPILFMQSDCSSMSGREKYVSELMTYIEIDSYGSCLKNRELPEKLKDDYLNNLFSPETLRFLGQYKFILSFENGICYDYITEKFWRPLIVGSIPIYFGAPTIRDWEPHNKSAIYIADFLTPKELATFVIQLDANDMEYISYLRHKYDQIEPVTNERLLHNLFTRDFPNLFYTNIQQNFKCALCAMIHNMPTNLTNLPNISRNTYKCPLKYVHNTEQAKDIENTDWKNIIEVGICEGELLDELLIKNVKYTNKKFINDFNNRLNNGQCSLTDAADY